MLTPLDGQLGNAFGKRGDGREAAEQQHSLRGFSASFASCNGSRAAVEAQTCWQCLHSCGICLAQIPIGAPGSASLSPHALLQGTDAFQIADPLIN